MNAHRLLRLSLLAVLLTCRFSVSSAVALDEETHRARDVTTVDFLASVGLDANALAPQAVKADPLRNRIFVACANSSAVAVIEGPEKTVTVIPVECRMPRRLRDPGMAVSGKTGRLYLCGPERLIIVDPEKETSCSLPLPGDYEVVSLDEQREAVFLTGRTRGDLAVVNGETGEIVHVPYAEPAPPLPFVVASDPPPIRVSVADPARGRVHVVDGLTSTLYTFDTGEPRLLGSRRLPLDVFPRWHVAGFDTQKGLIYGAVENARREMRHAFALDTKGGKDRILDLPEKHTEPQGVSCDTEGGRIFIPYDNMKVVHMIHFGKEATLSSVDVPAVGMDASVFDPRSGKLYVTCWIESVLYVIDPDQGKLVFTVPRFPVYPHMTSIALDRADGTITVPSGSMAVNGTFGAAVTVFDPKTLAFRSIRTGWGPVSLVRKPGSESYWIFDAEGEVAEVTPDGAVTRRRFPHPYPRQAVRSPDGDRVLVAYGPHSSMWPAYYIKGTRNGIVTLDARGDVIEDRLTPRLAQGMIHDGKGRLWVFQNTWGKQAPFLMGYDDDSGWFDLRLQPKVDNECVLRLLAYDPESGLLYAVRAGDRNDAPGRLHLVDPDSRTEKAAIEVGRTPTDLAVIPSFDAALVTAFDDGVVHVIYGKDVKRLDLDVGGRPFALGVAPGATPADAEAYVLDHAAPRITVLSIGRDDSGTLDAKVKSIIPLPPGASPDNLLVDHDTGRLFLTAHWRRRGPDPVLRSRHGRGDRPTCGPLPLRRGHLRSGQRGLPPSRAMGGRAVPDHGHGSG